MTSKNNSHRQHYSEVEPALYHQEKTYGSTNSASSSNNNSKYQQQRINKRQEQEESDEDEYSFDFEDRPSNYGAPSGIRLIIYVLSKLAIILLIAVQIYYFVLQTFLFTAPLGQVIFGRAKFMQEICKETAANLGFMTAMMAIGLAWGFLISIVSVIRSYQLFKRKQIALQQLADNDEDNSNSHEAIFLRSKRISSFNERLDRLKQNSSFGFQLKVLFLLFIITCSLHSVLTLPSTANLVYSQLYTDLIPAILTLLLVILAGY